MDQSILAYLLRCIAERQCTLRELAKASGVPYDTLTKIAQGQTIPRLDTAEKILRCFPRQFGPAEPAPRKHLGIPPCPQT